MVALVGGGGAVVRRARYLGDSHFFVFTVLWLLAGNVT